MSWIIEVDGKAASQKFATEEEANQAAANERGSDWDKKIVVRDESTPHQPQPQPQPAAKPQTVAAAVPVTAEPSKNDARK